MYRTHLTQFFFNLESTLIPCSSANGKKWEAELQTLKNNNARLTTALQESKSNVNKWKQQLSSYQEESTALKKKVTTTIFNLT